MLFMIGSSLDRPNECAELVYIVRAAVDMRGVGVDLVGGYDGGRGGKIGFHPLGPCLCRGGGTQQGST